MSRTRQIIAIVFLVASLPFIFFGLIDALEGGISMIFAGMILVVAHVLLNKKPAKYLWIPYVITIFLAIATLGYAVAMLQFTPGPTPLRLPVVIGNWLYRAGVAVTLVGAIVTLIRSIQYPQPTKEN